MPVNDLFDHMKLFAVHRTGQSQPLFSAVSANALIKRSTAVHGLHDFPCNLLILF